MGPSKQPHTFAAPEQPRCCIIIDTLVPTIRSPYQPSGAMNTQLPLGATVTLPTPGGVVTPSAAKLPVPPVRFANRLFGGMNSGGWPIV